jgi:hypothetical protein
MRHAAYELRQADYQGQASTPKLSRQGNER